MQLFLQHQTIGIYDHHNDVGVRVIVLPWFTGCWCDFKCNNF